MVSTPDSISPFKPAQSRGNGARILLGINIAIEGISIVFNWLEIDLLTRIGQGQNVDFAEANQSDARQQFLGWIQIATYIVTTILVLMWIHRANRNLRSLGARDLKFTPGWAVGWWFIPFMNLVRPFQVVAEIWKASNPRDADPQGTHWKTASTPSVLGLWWAAWLLSNFLAQVAIRLAVRQATLQTLLTSSWLTLVSSILSIIAAALLMNIIKTVDAWQQEKFNAQQNTPQIDAGSYSGVYRVQQHR